MVPHSQPKANPEEIAPLPAGSAAPDFRLHWSPGQSIQLSRLRGDPVILAFYVGSWNPVCADQLALLQETLPDFARFRAHLLGISIDHIWSQAAFARQLELTFPLLSDFEPKGAVARAYGVYRQQEGTSGRALFVLAPDGAVAWSAAYPDCVNPGVDGILTALEKLGAENNFDG